MISYIQGNEKQKNNGYNLVTEIFKAYTMPEEKKSYDVIKKSDCILVVVHQKKEEKKEDTDVSVESLRERFQTILNNLKEMDLFDFKTVIVRPRNTAAGVYSEKRFPAFTIDSINTELTNVLLNLPSDLIQKYMDSFSPRLQTYVEHCLKTGNLKEEFDNPFCSLALMSLAPSPIGLTRCLEIPVRLPNTILGISKEYYDLAELLRLPVNRDGTRNDPMTRQPFKLNQITPAPDMLEQIKSRVVAARNDEASENAVRLSRN